jgi:hypothetical protein
MTSFCADNLSTKNYKPKLKAEKTGQKKLHKKHFKKYGVKMLVKLIVEILRCFFFAFKAKAKIFIENEKNR